MNQQQEVTADETPRPTLQVYNREYIERVLRESGGKQAEAAKILGITRWSLARRLKKFRSVQ